MNPYLSITLMLPFIGLVGWVTYQGWKDEDVREVLVLFGCVIGIFGAIAAFIVGFTLLIASYH